jgi:hypothetical protein
MENELEQELQSIVHSHHKQFPDDWLLLLEATELAQNRLANSNLTLTLEKILLEIAERNPQKRTLIEDGLSLSNQL